MNETILGKITDVSFGKKDSRFGLWLTLSGEWTVQTSYVCWDPVEIIPDEYHKWTEKDRDVEMIDIMNKISKLLQQAKVENVNDLLNIPIEITFQDHILSSWRILEEVL